MSLRSTSPVRHLTVIRLLCAIPLGGIGAQHLLGIAPMEPILEGAGIPAVAFFSILVPVVEVVAALLLVLGLHARLAALSAMVPMAVAIYVHVISDWESEPYLILPVAVLVGLAQVLWGGAGAFSTDLAADGSGSRAPAT